MKSAVATAEATTSVEAASATTVEAAPATSLEFAAAAMKFIAALVSTSYKAPAFIASSPSTAVISVVPDAPAAATFAASPTFASPAFTAPTTASPKLNWVTPVVPRTGSNEEAIYEVIRSVKAIRRASIRIIIVVTVRADRRPTYINRASDAHSDSNLRLRVSHRQHQHREQREIFQVTHNHLHPDSKPFAPQSRTASGDCGLPGCLRSLNRWPLSLPD
jgi:hypothetical protein